MITFFIAIKKLWSKSENSKMLHRAQMCIENAFIAGQYKYNMSFLYSSSNIDKVKLNKKEFGLHCSRTANFQAHAPDALFNSFFCFWNFLQRRHFGPFVVRARVRVVTRRDILTRGECSIHITYFKNCACMCVHMCMCERWRSRIDRAARRNRTGVEKRRRGVRAEGDRMRGEERGRVESAALSGVRSAICASAPPCERALLIFGAHGGCAASWPSARTRNLAPHTRNTRSTHARNSRQMCSPPSGMTFLRRCHKLSFAARLWFADFFYSMAFVFALMFVAIVRFVRSLCVRRSMFDCLIGYVLRIVCEFFYDRFG